MKNRLALFLLGLFTLTISGCGSVSNGIYPDADKYLVGNQTYSENIESLDINWIKGNVTLVEDDTIEGVKIVEDTDLTIDEELVHSYLNDGELKIQFFASGYHKSSTHQFKKDLTITYKPTLKNIKIDLTSGTCTASKITTYKCDINITSGKVVIDELVANSTKTDQTSGLIEIKKIDTQELTSGLTSGSLTLGFIDIKKATLDMTSGVINMTLPEEGGKVKVSKTSGSVVSNRECTINEGTYTFNSGTADISVSMTSGTLILN